MKQNLWTTKRVELVKEQIANAVKLKRDDIPFYDNIPGLRKADIKFKMTEEEIQEYIKCKMDIHHFAENYCWIKGEKGDPVKIKLRDYQREILDNFFNNRFNILMASRQVGKCSKLDTYIDVYDKLSDSYKKVMLFELIYKYNKKKNIFDYIKYFLYKLYVLF